MFVCARVYLFSACPNSWMGAGPLPSSCLRGSTVVCVWLLTVFPIRGRERVPSPAGGVRLFVCIDRNLFPSGPAGGAFQFSYRHRVHQLTCGAAPTPAIGPSPGPSPDPHRRGASEPLHHVRRGSGEAPRGCGEASASPREAPARDGEPARGREGYSPKLQAHGLENADRGRSFYRVYIK